VEAGTDDDWATAAAVLRRGGLVCVPTESFYGLAAVATDRAAVARVLAAKRRRPDAPIACVAADWAQAARLWQAPPARAAELAARYWPGPLTLVAAAAAGLDPALCGPAGVGVRVPATPRLVELCRSVGAPLTATSANLTGAPPTRTVAEAQAQLGVAVDLYLDAGPTSGQAPSTVVEIEPSGRLRVVRAGAVTLAEEDLRWPR
jgi:L-threonylcarbamoyladenylate synthase